MIRLAANALPVKGQHIAQHQGSGVLRLAGVCLLASLCKLSLPPPDTVKDLGNFDWARVFPDVLSGLVLSVFHAVSPHAGLSRGFGPPVIRLPWPPFFWFPSH